LKSPTTGQDNFTLWIGGPNEEQNSYERLKYLIITCSFLTVNSRVLVQPLHRKKIDWNIPSSLSACFHSKHEYNSILSANFFTSSCFSSLCKMFSAKSYTIAPSSSCSSLASSQEVLLLPSVVVPILFEVFIWLLLF